MLLAIYLPLPKCCLYFSLPPSQNPRTNPLKSRSEVILYHRKVIYVQPGFNTEAFCRRSSPNLPGPLHIPPRSSLYFMTTQTICETYQHLPFTLHQNQPRRTQNPKIFLRGMPPDPPWQYLYSFPPKLEILDRTPPPIMAALLFVAVYMCL